MTFYKKEKLFEEAQELFTLADKKKVKLFVSSLTVANTHFLLPKHYNSNDARKILSQFEVLVEVLPLDDKVIELALTSDLKNFEDAIQFYTATEHNTYIIITRNKKDFKKQKLLLNSVCSFSFSAAGITAQR
ncbi:type II toxin-antitoxin system VapC family toxin [Niabella aquatica]